MAGFGKGRKIRRRRRRIFGKTRSHIWKKVGWVALGLFVVFSGFFVTKFLFENVDFTPAPSNSPSQTTTSIPQQTDVPTGTTSPPGEVPAAPNAALRAFHLQAGQLANSASLSTAIDGAVAAGFNAVVFDLKSEDGAVWYASSVPATTKAQSPSALSVERLREALGELHDAGLLPIARVFAFKDRLAPLNVPGGKITVTGESSYTWLDNSKENGGKPWLNPYSQSSQNYIIDISVELSNLGFTAILLDGVQFPHQISSANFGQSELFGALSWPQVLTKLVVDVTDAVSPQCRVIHAMPGLASFGFGDTDANFSFGANPVTFGAATVAPVLFPSSLGKNLSAGDVTVANPAEHPYDAVKLAADQIRQRVELIGGDRQPRVMPWIDGSLTAAVVKDQLRAVSDVYGNDYSCILYSANGRYPFAELR